MGEVHNAQHHTAYPTGGLCTTLDKYMTGGCVLLCTSAMQYTGHRGAACAVLCVMYLCHVVHSPHRWPVYYMAEVHNTTQPPAMYLSNAVHSPPRGVLCGVVRYVPLSCTTQATRGVACVVLCVMYLSNALHNPPVGCVVWCCVLCTSAM